MSTTLFVSCFIRWLGRYAVKTWRSVPKVLALVRNRIISSLNLPFYFQVILHPLFFLQDFRKFILLSGISTLVSCNKCFFQWPQREMRMDRNRLLCICHCRCSKLVWLLDVFVLRRLTWSFTHSPKTITYARRAHIWLPVLACTHTARKYSLFIIYFNTKWILFEMAARATITPPPLPR